MIIISFEVMNITWCDNLNCIFYMQKPCISWLNDNDHGLFSRQLNKMKTMKSMKYISLITQPFCYKKKLIITTKLIPLETIIAFFYHSYFNYFNITYTILGLTCFKPNNNNKKRISYKPFSTNTTIISTVNFTPFLQS